MCSRQSNVHAQILQFVKRGFLHFPMTTRGNNCIEIITPHDNILQKKDSTGSSNPSTVLTVRKIVRGKDGRTVFFFAPDAPFYRKLHTIPIK
jgi:hypothetical protein